MLETLSRYWWAVVLRGVVAVLFGVMALVWPGITVFALVVLFGAYALVDGVITLATAIGGNRERAGSRGWLVVEGIAGVLIGILTFAWPGVTALALLWLIAAWAIVTGVLEIVSAVRLRRELRHESARAERRAVGRVRHSARRLAGRRRVDRRHPDRHLRDRVRRRPGGARRADAPASAR